jgi:hypothetical protein
MSSSLESTSYALAGFDPDHKVDLGVEDLVDQLLVGRDAHFAAAVAVVADLLVLVLLNLEREAPAVATTDPAGASELDM